MASQTIERRDTYACEELLRRARTARAEAEEARLQSQAAVVRRDRMLERLLATADRILDQAVDGDHAVEGRLERARRLSALIGREPLIEDAKVAIARRHGCRPSEAYQMLRRVSMYQNRKLRDVARDVAIDHATDQRAEQNRELIPRELDTSR